MFKLIHRFERSLISSALVLLLSGTTVYAAETTPNADTDAESGNKIYKKVGPGGEVIYSDKPSPEAKEITVPSGSEYKPVLPPAGFTPYQPPQKKPAHVPIDNAITITAPTNDQAFYSGNGEMTVSVTLAKGLDAGQKLEYIIDGKQVYSGPDTSPTLSNIFRGTHVLTVRLVDPQGNSVSSGAVTFHMHRPIQHIKPPPTKKKTLPKTQN